MFYKVSVSSLFIFAILAETLRSIVRSPISTTRPPRISELTWTRLSCVCHRIGIEQYTLFVTFNFLPWPTYSDFATAASRRERVLLSNGYISDAHQHTSSYGRAALERGIDKTLTEALVTVNSTSPLAAPISSPNFSQTPFNKPSLLLAARVSRKFLTVSALSAPPVCFCSSATIADLSSEESVGAIMMLASLASLT